MDKQKPLLAEITGVVYQKSFIRRLLEDTNCWGVVWGDACLILSARGGQRPARGGTPPAPGQRYAHGSRDQVPAAT